MENLRIKRGETETVGETSSALSTPAQRVTNGRLGGYSRKIGSSEKLKEKGRATSQVQVKEKIA